VCKGDINNNNNNQRQCLWCYPHDHGHCESSPSSFDECRLSAGWPPTLRPSQPTWAVSPPINGCYRPQSTSTIAICYYYSARKLILILPVHGGWRLSRPWTHSTNKTARYYLIAQWQYGTVLQSNISFWFAVVWRSQCHPYMLSTVYVKLFTNREQPKLSFQLYVTANDKLSSL